MTLGVGKDQMIPKTSILKLWALNVAIMPVFIAGLWILGIPITNALIWRFLAVVLPLFSLVAAVAQSSITANRIDKDGISCPFPFAGRIPWPEVKRVHRQWPFVRVAGRTGQTALIPLGWLVKNRQEFDRVLTDLAQQSEAVRELKGIAEPGLLPIATCADQAEAGHLGQ